jgi:hypothetical protein
MRKWSSRAWRFGSASLKQTGFPLPNIRSVDTIDALPDEIAAAQYPVDGDVNIAKLCASRAAACHVSPKRD